MVYESNSAEETYEIGVEIGRKAKPGEIYVLSGQLGAGKTTFSQGFARGLSIFECVNSPTFTIVKSYDTGRMPFHHFDVYRIGGIEEMEEIGYEEYFFGEGVCLIEWPERIREIIPPFRRKVIIERSLDQSYNYRKITVV